MKAEIVEDSIKRVPFLKITPDTDAERMLLNLMLTGMAEDGISFKRMPGNVFRIHRSTEAAAKTLPLGDSVLGPILGGE